MTLPLGRAHHTHGRTGQDISALEQKQKTAYRLAKRQTRTVASGRKREKDNTHGKARAGCHESGNLPRVCVERFFADRHCPFRTASAPALPAASSPADSGCDAGSGELGDRRADAWASPPI